MVRTVKIFKNNTYVNISLQQYVDEYCKTLPKGWLEYLENWVNEGINISNQHEYEIYLKKLNLKRFDYKKVKTLYSNLTKSKYSELLEDDVLRFLSYMYGVGYFTRINYKIDINNPNLDEWLDIKNVFKPNREKISQNEGYSLKDLSQLRNGSNAIKHELVHFSKW